MKISEERIRGVGMEAAITLCEIVSCTVLYLISNNIYILAFIIFYDLISSVRHKFDEKYMSDATSHLKERNIDLRQNLIFYFIRSVSYVTAFVVILELAWSSDDDIVYYWSLVALVIAKLYREDLLRILHDYSKLEFKSERK